MRYRLKRCAMKPSLDAWYIADGSSVNQELPAARSFSFSPKQLHLLYSKVPVILVYIFL